MAHELRIWSKGSPNNNRTEINCDLLSKVNAMNYCLCLDFVSTVVLLVVFFFVSVVVLLLFLSRYETFARHKYPLHVTFSSPIDGYNSCASRHCCFSQFFFSSSCFLLVVDKYMLNGGQITRWIATNKWFRAKQPINICQRATISSVGLCSFMIVDHCFIVSNDLRWSKSWI